MNITGAKAIMDISRGDAYFELDTEGQLYMEELDDSIGIDLTIEELLGLATACNQVAANMLAKRMDNERMD